MSFQFSLVFTLPPNGTFPRSAPFSTFSKAVRSFFFGIGGFPLGTSPFLREQTSELLPSPGLHFPLPPTEACFSRPMAAQFSPEIIFFLGVVAAFFLQEIIDFFSNLSLLGALYSSFFLFPQIFFPFDPNRKESIAQ